MDINLNNELFITIGLQRGATAYVAIDSSINNTSSGGVRVAEDISADEIKALGREMTLKFSFIGLPRGGAKSGVKIPAGTSIEDKRQILGEFGRRLKPLIHAGIYYPGMDMNCGPDDLRVLYRGAGITLPAKATDTSYFTAISVANAIYACTTELLPADRPLTVAIEGFGSVGNYLASRLPAEKYRIVTLSTVRGAAACHEGFAPESLTHARKHYGDDLVNNLPGSQPVAMEEVLAADVDILVPAARTWSIHAGNVNNIRAKVIVPAANAPYTAETVDILYKRGIISLPGFVTNSGGVYASTLYDGGVSRECIEDISSLYYRPVVSALLSKSMELAKSPVLVAELVALRRLEAKMAGFSSESRADRLLKRLFLKGFVPRFIYGKRITSTFVKNLRELERQIAVEEIC